MWFVILHQWDSKNTAIYLRLNSGWPWFTIQNSQGIFSQKTNTVNVSGGKRGERECADTVYVCAVRAALYLSLQVTQSTLTSTFCQIYTEVISAQYTVLVLHHMLLLLSLIYFFGELHSGSYTAPRKCITACSESRVYSVRNDWVNSIHLLASSTWMAYLQPPPPNKAACSPGQDSPPGQLVLLHQTVNRSVDSLAQPEHRLPSLRTEILRDSPGLAVRGWKTRRGECPLYI